MNYSSLETHFDKTWYHTDLQVLVKFQHDHRSLVSLTTLACDYKIPDEAGNVTVVVEPFHIQISTHLIAACSGHSIYQ